MSALASANSQAHFILQLLVLLSREWVLTEKVVVCAVSFLHLLFPL